MKIFSGSSNKDLAQKIAHGVNEHVSPLEIHLFPDGERRIRVEEKVLDEDTVIIQPTNPPVDQNYIELFLIADALKRSGAKSVTAIIPYLGYQRQDHVFRDGEAVSLDVMVHALESTGVSKVIVVDLHTIKTPEVFRIPLTHISALSVFAQKIKELQTRDSVLVSPDMGGIRRIEIISKMLGNMPIITVNKNRDLATGEISSTEFAGEIKKTAFIVDDMSSSGKTLVEAGKLLRKKGAEKIYAFVTHALFSKDACELLQNSTLEKVYVTDSVFVPEEKRFAKLEILSIAGEISKALRGS